MWCRTKSDAFKYNGHINSKMLSLYKCTGHTLLPGRKAHLPFSCPSCLFPSLQLLTVGVRKLLPVPQPMCSGPQHSPNHRLIMTVNHTTQQYKFGKKLHSVCCSSTLISGKHLACNITMAQNGASLLQFLETKAGQMYPTGLHS